MNNTDVLTNLNNVIRSFSRKTDFYEIEDEFFCSISSIIPAHAIAIYHFKSAELHPDYISAKGIDKDFLKYYEKEGRGIDPLKNWIMNTRAPYLSHKLLGLEGWKHHPVYKIVKTASIDYAMQAPIVSGNRIVGSLNFGRDFKEGAFTDSDLLTLSILSNFLGIAINGIKGSGVEDYTNKFCNTVDRMNYNMVIADSDFNISYANKSAQETITRYFGSNNFGAEFSRKLRGLSKSDSNNEIVINDNLKCKSCVVPGTKQRKKILFLDDNPVPVVNDIIRNVLTSREIDVLLLVDQGLKNKEIAEKLFISVNTVKRHLDNMYGKFNVESRTKLVSKFHNLNSRQLN
jgi:DNA-binding CsgD family transcriptional regulator